MGRYECPVPTSPACNADCLGCLSYQEEESGFSESQFRLEFAPTPDEISQIIVHHFERVDYGVASFGQGCEGEPLLRGNDLTEAIKKVREKTDRGTININTNGSRPDIVKSMISAGLDSIRVSLNSPTEKYYNAYHRPVNYTYGDVMKTIETALESGIFVSINLFFMPGFTDSLGEVESITRFLDKYPVSMIQTRNLNIDPDYYFEKTGFIDEDAIGIAELIKMFREKYPKLRLGYYNPPLKL
jgi:molybdenum cofactor biosynthesis enzyme MoaA